MSVGQTISCVKVLYKYGTDRLRSTDKRGVGWYAAHHARTDVVHQVDEPH